MKLITGLIITLSIFIYPKTTVRQTVSNSKFRSEFLENINHVREKGCTCGSIYMPPAPPLIWNDQLEMAAIGHAVDMYDKSYFSHTSKNGRTMDKRIMGAGYTMKGYQSFAIGENIAQGQQSITEVMAGWFKSEGHCKNLMNPAFKEVGAAAYNTYWVQDFGGREPFSAAQQKLLKSGKYKMIERN
jgi:uncharacterized protein YkwD